MKMSLIKPFRGSLLGVLLKGLSICLLISCIRQQQRRHRPELHPPESSAPTIGEQLKQRVRLMCIILTDDDRDKHYAQYAERSWVADCDFPLFVSNNENLMLEPLVFNTTQRWPNVRNALEYVHKYHLEEADWFLVARDDNFVVMPNLRYMLYPYSSEEPIYFGYEMNAPNTNESSYMRDEAGYVLSKEALRRLVERALPKAKLFRRDAAVHAELELSHYLEREGVKVGDNRDSDGGLRILPVHLQFLLNGTHMLHHYGDMIANSPYEYQNGLVKLSPHVAIFAGVQKNDYFALRFFFRDLHLFGVPDADEVSLPPLRSTEETVPHAQPVDGIFNILRL